MVKLTLPENSKIVEGKKPSEKRAKTQFVSIFTDGTEKMAKTPG